MSLTSEALKRLKAARDADYLQPWRPGKQLTDNELLWMHIEKLTNELSLTKDALFLHTYEDRMGGQFSRDEIEQAERGRLG